MRQITAAAAAALLGVALAGCAGPASSSTPSPSATAAVPSAATSASASAPVLPSLTADPNADTGVPPEWPAEIPGYVGGSILAATVTPDGLNVNGSWATPTPADAAWAQMDARLRALGYVTTAEASGEDQLVDSGDQRSDYFVKSGAEVNLVVIPGKQTTVMVNGSLS